MGKDIILQSVAPRFPDWIARCTDSVARWAGANGFRYEMLGDELFDPLPEEWVAMAGPLALPRTDYARLLWIKRLHDKGHARVIWIDADVLVIDGRLSLPPEDFFCREDWIFAEDGDSRLFVRSGVNNCAMAFASGSPLLDWYLERCRLEPADGPLRRLALGPKMLSERHRAAALPLIGTVATISPWVMQGLLNADSRRIETFFSIWQAPVEAAHICRSLGHTSDAPALVPPHLYDPLIDCLERGALTNIGGDRAARPNPPCAKLRVSSGSPPGDG